MRRSLVRILAGLSLVVAVLLPAAPGIARAGVEPAGMEPVSASAAIPVPSVQQCAPALLISGRRIAGCGQAWGDRGRVGTYDSASGAITWGPWQNLLDVQLPNRMTVTASDGYSGRFVGFPALPDRFGRTVVHGTQYRRVTAADQPLSYVGRRGVYRLGGGLFEPSEGWYPMAGCVPAEPCPEWHYEPAPEVQR